jgi:two-component system phosphate regulon sensor histidine kinase PhoR
LIGSATWLALAASLAILASVASFWAAYRKASSIAAPNPPVAAVTAPSIPIDALLAALADAAVVVRRDGTMIGVNEAAGDLLGLRRGLNLRAMLRSPELRSALDRAATENIVTVAEISAGIGPERQLAARITPLTGVEPGFDVMLATFRDRSQDALLDRARADFVANASHELRTPLAAVKGFIDTLQGAARDDAVAREEFLEIMSREADRMTRLIDDLLSLSRVEMRAHMAPTDPVDMRAVVEEVAVTLRPMAERMGASVVVAVPAEPVVILGERDELVQLVQNLGQNGVKYGKIGGTLAIRLSRIEDSAAVVVADDGIGIGAEHLPRLTERFYRVNTKASQERGGTGLGLAIAKHIVNRHRGRLGIESRLGEGTVVTVSIPLARSS